MTSSARAGLAPAATSTMQRWFPLFGDKPHRRRTFKLSGDPFLIGKVRDAAGLCLNPPDNAAVLFVDGKSRIQALDRTRPVLPMGLGHVEGCTHDYIRRGYTTLFAALDAETGKAVAGCAKRRRHQEFPAFLGLIDRETPPGPGLHPVPDNCVTRKHPKVRAWPAKRPQFRLRFTPASASWPDQVERWFAIISRRAIKRGSFNSAPSSSAPSNGSLRTATGPRPRSSGWRQPIQSSAGLKD